MLLLQFLRDLNMFTDCLVLLGLARLFSSTIFLIVWFVRSQVVSSSGPRLMRNLFFIRKIHSFSRPLLISINRRFMRWLMVTSTRNHSVTRNINRSWLISTYSSPLDFRIWSFTILWRPTNIMSICQPGGLWLLPLVPFSFIVVSFVSVVPQDSWWSHSSGYCPGIARSSERCLNARSIWCMRRTCSFSFLWYRSRHSQTNNPRPGVQVRCWQTVKNCWPASEKGLNGRYSFPFIQDHYIFRSTTVPTVLVRSLSLILVTKMFTPKALQCGCPHLSSLPSLAPCSLANILVSNNFFRQMSFCHNRSRFWPANCLNPSQFFNSVTKEPFRWFSLLLCPQSPCWLPLQAHPHIKNSRVKVSLQKSQSVSFPVVDAEIPDVVPLPRAGDGSNGFEFLKDHLHPGTFFRLWHRAPLADAVAMTDEKVIDLIQAYYPQNHQPDSKMSHKFEGSKQWLDAFPGSGYSFRYYTVTHENLLEKIGWPQGLTDELCESFTPFLIGLSLDIVALPASAAGSSSAGAIAEVEEEKEEKEEKSAIKKGLKKRPPSPSSSQPPAKRREHCCRCSSGTCDKCRCAKSRCDSSCQSSACHVKSGAGAGSAVTDAKDDGNDPLTEDWLHNVRICLRTALSFLLQFASYNVLWLSFEFRLSCSDICEFLVQTALDISWWTVFHTLSLLSLWRCESINFRLSHQSFSLWYLGSRSYS